MADRDLNRSFRSRDGGPFIVFLVLSLVINGLGACCGWWLKFPEPPPLKDDALQLTAIDTNDVEKLGEPNAQEDSPPPEPEPAPPPEPEPTPPTLDKPEFEIPEPTPAATLTPAATPENSPKPKPAPKRHAETAVRLIGASSAHPGTAPGLVKGSPTGAPDGTGNGGPRSGLLVRSPRPPYPPQALQMHITGDVRVRLTVEGGNVVEAEASGPPMLASAAARWVRANWKFSPTTSGTYTLPVSFVLTH
jgi:outer membrane biosynthesis protein TonB